MFLATRFVISTDLSHYQDYETAQKLDGATAKAIESMNPTAIGREQACGRVPVSGMLIAAKKRGMSVERIDLRNSGDTAGKKDKVVGYGSWAVCGDSTKAPIENAPPDSDRAMLEKEGARIFRAAAQALDTRSRTESRQSRRHILSKRAAGKARHIRDHQQERTASRLHRHDPSASTADRRRCRECL